MRAAVSLIEGTPLLYAKLIQNKATIKVLAVKHKFLKLKKNKTMQEPKYFKEMLPYFPSNIDERIKEIEKELVEIQNLRNSNRVSSEDIEDISDNYQYNLEWNELSSELNDELKCLKYQQYLDLQNESELNALENQSLEQ